MNLLSRFTGWIYSRNLLSESVDTVDAVDTVDTVDTVDAVDTVNAVNTVDSETIVVDS